MSLVTLTNSNGQMRLNFYPFMTIDFLKVSTERPPLGHWNEVRMEKEGSILTSKYCR